MVPFRSSSAAPSVLLSPSPNPLESILQLGMSHQSVWYAPTDNNNAITNPNTSPNIVNNGLAQQRQHSISNTSHQQVQPPTTVWQPNPTTLPVAPEQNGIANIFSSTPTHTRTWAESNDANDDAEPGIGMDMDMDNVDPHDVEVNRRKRRRTHSHNNTAPITPSSFTSPPAHVVDSGMAIVERTPPLNLQQQPLNLQQQPLNLQLQPNQMEYLQSLRANFVLDKMLQSRRATSSNRSIVPYAEAEANTQAVFVADFIRKLGLTWSVTQQGYTSSVFLHVKQDWLERWKRQVDSDDVYRVIFKTEDGQEIMLEGGLQQQQLQSEQLQSGPLLGSNSDDVNVKMVLKLRELNAASGQKLLTWSPSSLTPPHPPTIDTTHSVTDLDDDMGNVSHDSLNQSTTPVQWQHQPNTRPNMSSHVQPQPPYPNQPPQFLSQSPPFQFDRHQQSNTTNNERNRKRQLAAEHNTENEHQDNFQPQWHANERLKRFKR